MSSSTRAALSEALAAHIFDETGITLLGNWMILAEAIAPDSGEAHIVSYASPGTTIQTGIQFIDALAMRVIMAHPDGHAPDCDCEDSAP